MNNKTKLFTWCLEQARRIVEAYRAEAPMGFDPMGQAYGQTDVWNDPGWVRTTAQGHGATARQAQERLREMQEEAGRQQQAREFGAAHAQTSRQFEDTRADREQRERAIESGRQEGLAQRTAAARESELRVLEGMAGNPADPNSRAAQTELARRLNLSTPQTPTDQRASDVGKTVTSGAQGTQQPTGQPTPAPRDISQLQYSPTELTSSGAPRMMVPPGMDVNVNTGQLIPHNAVGTFNGQPIDQYLAKSALARGTTPEIPEAQHAFNILQKQEKDRLEVGAGAPTTPPGYTGGPAAAPGSKLFNPTSGGGAAITAPATQPQTTGQPPAAGAPPTVPPTGGQPTTVGGVPNTSAKGLLGEHLGGAVDQFMHALIHGGPPPWAQGGGQPQPPRDTTVTANP